MCISCIKEEVSNHFLFFLCLYLLCKLYHNIIQALCYNHFNNSIKIKSIDQWEVWFGEHAPRGGNSFV